MQALSQEHPPLSVRQRVRLRWESLGVWLELMRNLAVRDVETRYKHSLLGLYWTIINPLVYAGIFSFVFAVIFRASSGKIPYVVFLLTGLTFWNFFGNGIGSATGSITGSASLLSKVYFPRVVLPTAAVLARLIDLAFALLVLLVFILIYHVPVHWTAVLILPLLAVEMLFAMGIGYMTAAMNVLYRDFSQLVGLLLMAWMYLTPVMYPATGHASLLSAVLLGNPMGGIIEAMRDLLYYGTLHYPLFLWSALLWSGFVFLAGLTVFKRIEPLFAEVM